MDISLLIKLLAPSLPFLITLGKKAAEKSAEKIGEKSVEGILPSTKMIWNKLRPKVMEKEAAREAAEDVAKDPNNSLAVGALQYQLQKILEEPENQELAKNIMKIMEEKEKDTKRNQEKFNIKMTNSQTGAIGDNNTVTMNLNPKTDE